MMGKRIAGPDGIAATLQNRVLPTGEIVAEPACRGTCMGNRGRLHDADRRLGRARWRHKAWVCCRLDFRGRKRKVMAPGRYTELFFLDEAVAFAAGHRPCAECRRADFTVFLDAWAEAHGVRPRAPDVDAALHPARVRRDRTQVRHDAPREGLPDGAFVLLEGRACLVLGGAALPFAPEGYGPPFTLGTGLATVLTPAPLLAVFAAGYRPALHPSAGV